MSILYFRRFRSGVLSIEPESCLHCVQHGVGIAGRRGIIKNPGSRVGTGSRYLQSLEFLGWFRSIWQFVEFKGALSIARNKLVR